jgi:general secretion pathway protein F
MVFLARAVFLAVADKILAQGNSTILRVLRIAAGLFLFILCAVCFYMVPVHWFLLALAVLGMMYVRHAAGQQDAMLGLMASAVEHNISLALACAAIGDERSSQMAQRAYRVADLLSVGEPLVDALAAVPGIVPRDALPLLSVACASGSLGPGLRRILANRNSTSLFWQSIIGRIAYLLYVPAFFAIVVGFLLLVIAPKYEMIFKDFGTELPDETIALFSLYRNISLVQPIGIAVLIFVWLLLFYIMLRVSGLAGWDLPGMGWFTRRLDRAVILDGLSLAAQGQRPLPETVELLAKYYPKWAIRRRLNAALEDINQGREGLECLRRRGLVGAMDVAVLQAGARNGNLAWAAHEMADSNRRRFQYRAMGILQTLFPTAILILGGVTALLAMAIFKPVIALIIKMSTT